MTARLMLIWDYDTAIGQVNATYPYKFDEKKIFAEIENVETILELGKTYGLRMTFACVGFAAEPGVFPYHVPEQIARIFQAGHEVASHSWKHEWFPFLKRDQIHKSLERSKYALEVCVQKDQSVKGFVPPFSRPMSWYSRGALSLGDRAWGPQYPGANLPSLLSIVKQAGYRWCRVAYRTLLQRIRNDRKIDLGKPWHVYKDVICVPQHYGGFDETARNLLDESVKAGAPIVVVGHPSGLSRGKEENIEHLKRFLDLVGKYQSRNQMIASAVTQYIESRTVSRG